MMVAKHTPAPWRFFVNEMGFTIENNTLSKVICQRAAMVDHAELTANATLIAAAPELYDALYQLMMVADDTEDFTPKQVSEILHVSRALLIRITTGSHSEART